MLVVATRGAYPPPVLGQHVILRLGDDRVIAPSREARRRFARKMAELSRELPLLAWRLADTHLHAIALGEAAAAELIRRLRMWFTRVARPGVALEVQRRKPILSQSHLESAFRYVLTQDVHHGVETDLGHEASSLPDTLGLRTICPEVAVRVREHLPRLKREVLLGWLGVAALDEAASADHLRDAALAAFALDELTQRAEGADARRAAACAGLPAAEVATRLGISPRSARRLVADGAPPRWTRAVRLQMGLRAALAARPVVEEPPMARYVAC